MVSRFVVSILAGLLFVVPCWAADSGGGTLGVDSTAVPMCAFTSAPTAISQSNMALTNAGTDVSAVTITDVVDENTATLKRASIQLSMKGVCNHAHQLALMTTKGALLPSTPVTSAGGTFLTQIGYNATVTWGNQAVALVTDGTAGKKSNFGSISSANAGFVNIDIAIDESNNDFSTPIIAGHYSDTLIIQIGSPF